MASTPIPQYYAPPQGLVPIDDPAWTRWLYEVVWQAVGKGLGTSGVQGTFPKLQVDKATFDDSHMVQDLLTVNKGLYSVYYTTNSNIVYGYAANVHRSSGTSFVVAAQLNAWAETGVTCSVVGIATEAHAQPGSKNCSVAGIEPSIINEDDANNQIKWGMNLVFKNREDGVASVVRGVGSNLYNWGASAEVITAQARSGAGEFCGWNVGIDFLDGWDDQDNPPAWSAVVSYQPGQTVISGGQVWKSITGGNLNNVPAGGSAFWVLRSLSTTNKAVGIDFSSMSVAALAKMASAIRLRTSAYIHFDEGGTIGLKMDSTSNLFRLDNQTTFRFGVDVTSGEIYVGNAPVTAVGGAAVSLRNVGSGPSTAQQNAWLKIFNGATAYWIPLWQ